MFASSGGIGYISRHLRTKQPNQNSSRRKETGASVQQLYDLSFALWSMTYECNESYFMRSSFVRNGAIKSLCELVTRAPREKVVRVALASLRNLAECSAESSTPVGRRPIHGFTFLQDMISCCLMKNIEFMLQRQWTDIDIVEDLEILKELLYKNYKEMSRWDAYENEVLSGNLEWGILHTEKFFRENNKQIEGKDGSFSLLKKLTSLVSGGDEDVASIACFDVGEFARHYPNGRMITRRVGAKDAVMKLIEHGNPDLQRHALLSVSKMMVQRWKAVK